MITALLFALAVAPTVVPPDALTLDASLAMARAVQPALRAAEADASLAEARGAGARAATRPGLELQGGYLNSSARLGPLDFISNNGPPQYRAQLVGRWPLDTGALAASVQSVESEAEAARWRLAATQRALDLAVGQAYFGVLRAAATVDTLRAAREAARRASAATQARFANGQVTRLDVGRQAQVALGVEADLAGALADHGAARARFRILTGAASDFRLRDPGAPPAVTPPTEPDARPEVRQAAATAAAQQAAAAAAGLARRPQVSLTAAAGWDAQTFPGLHNYGYAAGFDVGWPFLDGGRLASQADQAAYAALRAEAELAVARQAAQTDLVDALARYRRAASQHGSLRRGADLAARNLAMTQVGFTEGAVGGLDLLAAQRAAIDARLAATNALYDAHLAAAQVRWAAGLPGKDAP